MSNRGSLVSSPQSDPAMIAESASYISLFWLSFLTAGDLEAAASPGQYELDCDDAIHRSTARIALYSAVFPDVTDVAEMADSLLDTIRAQKCGTIGIELTELVSEAEAPLNAAVQALQSGNPDYSLTIPPRTVENPFTGENVDIPEKTYRSLADVLLAVCMVDRGDLQSSDREEVREWMIGYMWDKDGS